MIRYIKKKPNTSKPYVTGLYSARSEGKKIAELLWGDRCEVIDSSDSMWKVKARGKTGYVSSSWLGTKSLLEFYFIDVGQGDGVLIRTPDDRHIMIDGGWPRKSQPTGKNAADFVDWKFFKDYGLDTIRLDAMICSHNDQDHYGGLWDLLKVDDIGELNAEHVTVEQFYHAGLSWWKPASGSDKVLGPSSDTADGPMWTRLLRDRPHLLASLSGSGGAPKLAGEWASFLREVSRAKRADGTPTPVTRLSHATQTLPGFDGDDLKIHVIGPVEFTVGNDPAIRKFPDGDSKNTNGNSVLLRVDYGSARILLTGDLNFHSQRSLLDDYAGNTGIFESDVAKACHHGSGDVSFEFLEKMRPACTVISSGDSEGHDHPKPEIVGASGLSGYKTLVGDKLVTPLVYSTELARSSDLGKITSVTHRALGGNETQWEGKELNQLHAHYSVTKAGDRNPTKGSARLSDRPLAAKNVYGLVNIRTDGETIMCAALNEKDREWNVADFKARF